MHKKIQIVIIDLHNSMQRVLLLKTNKTSGNFWQNVTGSVEKNEDFMKAAKRELFEETGITNINLIELPLSFEFHDRLKRYVNEKVYLALIDSSHNVIKLSNEHEESKWLTIDEVNEENYGYHSNYDALLSAKNVLRQSK